MTQAINRRALIAGGGVLALGACATRILASPPWRALPIEPFAHKQDDIYFISRNEGWYGNGAGRLYRTRDGGESWVKVWEHPGTYIRALGFVDAHNGFLGNVGAGFHPSATDPVPLYRTQDGGSSWEAVVCEGIEAVKGICAIDILRRGGKAPLIHAAGRVGGPAMMLRSADGGETWRLIDLQSRAGMILDVKFLDADIGFICAGSLSDLTQTRAAILRTTDGGAHWERVYEGERPSEICWKMSFPSRRIGYATVQNNGRGVSQQVVVKTMDAGASWQELQLVDDAASKELGIGFVTEDRGWLGTATTGFETLNGGRTWQRVDFGRSVNKIRIIREGSSFSAYAIGVGVARLDGRV